MRADGFAEVDVSGDCVSVKIDDVDGAAVGAWLSHSRIAVDGNVSEFSVGRNCDFVAVYADFDFAKCGVGGEVKHEQGVIALIGDDEESWLYRRRARERISGAQERE
jgi:hypothetical protein